MKQRRDTTQTIWRTVVFAGAMLGTGACHHDTPAPTTPTTPATPAHAPTPDPTATPTPAPDPAQPTASADPRPRGGVDAGVPDAADSADEAPVQYNRPRGRGFVLS